MCRKILVSRLFQELLGILELWALVSAYESTDSLVFLMQACYFSGIPFFKVKKLYYK